MIDFDLVIERNSLGPTIGQPNLTKSKRYYNPNKRQKSYTMLAATGTTNTNYTPHHNAAHNTTRAQHAQHA